VIIEFISQGREKQKPELKTVECHDFGPANNLEESVQALFKTQHVLLLGLTVAYISFHPSAHISPNIFTRKKKKKKETLKDKLL
jgi:hypothetical protein